MNYHNAYRAVFPVEPMQTTYWLDGVELLSDIPQELANRIAYRPWTDVTMLDWTMTGVRASTARSYFDADAFRYYLPSLLVGCRLATGMCFASGQEAPNNWKVVAGILGWFFS